MRISTNRRYGWLGFTASAIVVISGVFLLSSRKQTTEDRVANTPVDTTKTEKLPEPLRTQKVEKVKTIIRPPRVISTEPKDLAGDETTFADSLTGLMWLKRSKGPFTWAQAQDYCESLEHRGVEDWRMPSLDEVRLLSVELIPDDGVMIVPPDNREWALMGDIKPRHNLTGLWTSAADGTRMAEFDPKRNEVEWHNKGYRLDTLCVRRNGGKATNGRRATTITRYLPTFTPENLRCRGTFTSKSGGGQIQFASLHSTFDLGVELTVQTNTYSDFTIEYGKIGLQMRREYDDWQDLGWFDLPFVNIESSDREYNYMAITRVNSYTLAVSNVGNHEFRVRFRGSRGEDFIPKCPGMMIEVE